MFKKNTKHLQPAIISAASELPEKQRKRLESSWAGTFYNQFFCRIKEETFAVLYSDIPSRPNVAVNVLIGLEALKAGYGWSDQELYENYCYNLQVRYALGYDRLGDGDFEIRTLYYFRERLSRYNAEQGINLLEKAFEQITDAQIMDLKVRTGMQRMDSTQIASNIVFASRLQLMVETFQRVERMLNAADKARLADMLAPYIQDSAGHYTYRVKGKEAVQEHLQQIGRTIHTLLLELKPAYASEPAYQVMERIFAENFHLLEGGLRVKENTELTSGCLQSVDDLEATYRTKGKNHYKGYVANITETCDPENDLQLITKMQVAPNNVDDAQLMEETLPNLKERTELDVLYTDGGYGSPSADHTLRDNQIKQIQTAIRGRAPSTEKLNLADFRIKQDESGKPAQITCPRGQSVMVHSSSHKKAYVAHFGNEVCQACPLVQKCPAQRGKRDPRWHLRFSQEQANVSQRRCLSLIHQEEGRNLRAAVEATVRSVKHPFPAGKLPVRGQFRITCMLIGSAMMTNARRIQHYLETRKKLEAEQPLVSFFASLKTDFCVWTAQLTLQKLSLGC
ncbi:MAG: transposase [Anaerolineales bacterium]|uniref:Transposase n=1 Tax=Candidatus Desulfolinea nitratireducens TaxID=2841698 RepID=A0A8J6NIG9_9CHLR|nr:transposase [Candidatus Desulfolinea nitratireducens]